MNYKRISKIVDAVEDDLVIENGRVVKCNNNPEVVVIPEGVTSIASEAFRAQSMKHIKLPKGLRKIENMAFAFCEDLQEISFPDGLVSIGAGAFFGCKALKKVVIPDSVKSMEEKAFDSCTGLSQVKLSSNLRKIERRTFFETALTEVTIPASVSEIESHAFAYCDFLEKVILLNSNTKVNRDGENASFAECPILDKESRSLVGPNESKKFIPAWVKKFIKASEGMPYSVDSSDYDSSEDEIAVIINGYYDSSIESSDNKWMKAAKKADNAVDELNEDRWNPSWGIAHDALVSVCKQLGLSGFDEEQAAAPEMEVYFIHP